MRDAGRQHQAGSTETAGACPCPHHPPHLKLKNGRFEGVA